MGRPYLTGLEISTVSSQDNPVPISTSQSGPFLAPTSHSHQSDFWSLLEVFPLLDLHLNEDGSTADSLNVPLPVSAITASEEFASMLDGLPLFGSLTPRK
jgi:hypothetical protein